MVNYIDIKLSNVSDATDKLGYFDISIDSDGDLKKEDGFDTNIIVSLFGERRASSDEVTEPLLRRGWWGNTVNENGFENGSKLWLLDQSRLTTSTVNLCTQYAAEGLKWLKDDGYIFDVIVTSVPTYEAGSPKIALQVDLIRNDSSVEYKYFTVWNNTGSGA